MQRTKTRIEGRREGPDRKRDWEEQEGGYADPYPEEKGEERAQHAGWS
jgi:hypothetical protein